MNAVGGKGGTVVTADGVWEAAVAEEADELGLDPLTAYVWQRVAAEFP